MIFARKIHEFYTKIARKFPVSYAYYATQLDSCVASASAVCTGHNVTIGQLFLSDTVRSRRLSFLGHLYTASILGKIITELSRPALRAHLTAGDGGLVVQGNPSEP